MPPTTASELKHCKQLADSWAPVLRALANEERLLIVLWLADSECSVRELEDVIVGHHATIREQCSLYVHRGRLTGRFAGSRYNRACPDFG